MSRLLSFFINSLPQILYSVFFLYIVAFYLVRKEKNLRFLKTGFYIFLLLTILVVLSQALILYAGYQHSEFLHYLVRLDGYYWTQITRLVISQIVSLFIALIFSSVIFVFAQKTNQEIIDTLDVFLLVFCFFVVGWPNILIFLALLFLCTILGSLLLVIFKKRKLSERFNITPYLPLAFLITLWFGQRLAAWTLLNRIRF